MTRIVNSVQAYVCIARTDEERDRPRRSDDSRRVGRRAEQLVYNEPQTVSKRQHSFETLARMLGSISPITTHHDPTPALLCDNRLWSQVLRHLRAKSVLSAVGRSPAFDRGPRDLCARGGGRLKERPVMRADAADSMYVHSAWYPRVQIN